jgi:hypothetical protein
MSNYYIDLTFLLLLAGCADSGSDSVSDIPKSKKISEITNAEAVQICEWTQSDWETLSSGICTLAGMDYDVASNAAEC